MAAGVGPDSTVCWEVDLSQARPLLEAGAGGAEWAAALLHCACVLDVGMRDLELVDTSGVGALMIGQPIANFCPPESWTALAELIAAVAADRPDHAIRSTGISSLMFRNAVLSVWGAAGDSEPDRLWVAVDGQLTDDRSFWAVCASEQRYRRLIHHLPGALLQIDARAVNAIFSRLRSEGVDDIASYLETRKELVEAARQLVRVTDANDGAVQLFAAAGVEALIGPIDYLFAAAPDTARRVMSAHFENRRHHSEPMKLRRLDGSLIDVQLTITLPTPPERLDVTLITLEDITDRLRTEAQLRQLQAEYGRAARISTLGELASSIAHEVNQPLSAIAMNAETCLRWLARDEPNLAKVTELSGRIAESAHRASEIVQRIRGMAARHVPERMLIDLNEVVEEALLFVRHDIEAREIDLSLRLGAGLQPVLADRVQLQQVIVNLFVNSIQAMSQASAGGGWIALETGMDADNVVTFSIRDGGPGIDPENLDRVFDGFFTTKEEGVGIGLAICQSIIVGHGGRIMASNHPAGGAVFRFMLPGGTAPGHD